MSSAAFSPHIPDLDLITYYSERQASFFSKVSPWTKFGCLIFIVLAITLTRNLFILLGMYIVVVALYAAARLPLGKLVAWYTLPLLFVISLIGLLIWNEPGIPLASISLWGFTITLTDNGLLLIGTLTLKAFISVTFSLFFLMTTRYQHFAAMISRIFPTPLDQIFLMAYRFLFLTLSMIASMLKSVRSRGGSLIHSVRMQGRLFAGIFALVFIRSFERGERVHKAMTARGFTGSYSSYGEVPRPAFPGFALLIALAIVSIALVITSPYRGW
ncbi:energy-coupling factor transporter transmembrane component T [uncultured Methanoregula sp.]|uniref:energy-coupling factor transporter transmembrane component T family protein n=1 Tax=uncultured Methanoregula sp. TaxID=1005933 RepID=UPI002AABF45B|nr:energy-coupling factor transporter transmembrane component T [uncultured Methanoregula sp.]